MLWVKALAGLGLAFSLMPGIAFAETAPEVAPGFAKIPAYRTWITLENFEMVSNGEPSNPVSNVKIEVVFPGGKKFELPEGGQYWTIGNGQIQDIKRTFELPASVIANDGFEFTIQMVRKGSKMLPCNFKVSQLSQYNRTYFCHTDIAWQTQNRTPEEKLDKEGINLRVWTDLNTPLKEQPKDALALK